jgi:hypothetical protein
LKPAGELPEHWRNQYALCLLFCLLKNASIATIPGVNWPDRQKLVYCAAGKLVKLAEAYLELTATLPDATRTSTHKGVGTSP